MGIYFWEVISIELLLRDCSYHPDTNSFGTSLRLSKIVPDKFTRAIPALALWAGFACSSSLRVNLCRTGRVQSTRTDCTNKKARRSGHFWKYFSRTWLTVQLYLQARLRSSSMSRVAARPACGCPKSFQTILSKIRSIGMDRRHKQKSPQKRAFLFEWWAVRDSNARPPD